MNLRDRAPEIKLLGSRSKDRDLQNELQRTSFRDQAPDIKDQAPDIKLQTSISRNQASTDQFLKIKHKKSSSMHVSIMMNSENNIVVTMGYPECCITAKKGIGQGPYALPCPWEIPSSKKISLVERFSDEISIIPFSIIKESDSLLTIMTACFRFDLQPNVTGQRNDTRNGKKKVEKKKQQAKKKNKKQQKADTKTKKKKVMIYSRNAKKKEEKKKKKGEFYSFYEGEFSNSCSQRMKSHVYQTVHERNRAGYYSCDSQWKAALEKSGSREIRPSAGRENCRRISFTLVLSYYRGNRSWKFPSRASDSRKINLVSRSFFSKSHHVKRTTKKSTSNYSINLGGRGEIYEDRCSTWKYLRASSDYKAGHRPSLQHFMKYKKGKKIFHKKPHTLFVGKRMVLFHFGRSQCPDALQGVRCSTAWIVLAQRFRKGSHYSAPVISGGRADAILPTHRRPNRNLQSKNLSMQVFPISLAADVAPSGGHFPRRFSSRHIYLEIFLLCDSTVAHVQLCAPGITLNFLGCQDFSRKLQLHHISSTASNAASIFKIHRSSQVRSENDECSAGCHCFPFRNFWQTTAGPSG
ncbi:unnamed protein product, partial [Nesidiocoris tenuis]